MFMELKEAIEKAAKAADKPGFIMTSAMTKTDPPNRISHWDVVFNNSEKNLAFFVHVTKDSVTVGEPSKPLISQKYSKLSVNGYMSSKDIYAKVLHELVKKGKSAQSVLLVVREGEWKVAIVTKKIKIIRMDLNATTGELSHFSENSLLKSDL